MTPIDTTQIRYMARLAKAGVAPPQLPSYLIWRPSPEASSIDELANAIEMLCDLIDQKDAKFHPQ